MTTRYRTAFMAPSGFTAATPCVSKSGKHVAPASERKAAQASRVHGRGAPEVKTERPGKSEAA